ncbi:ATPase [Vibrio galatheae]|uniref:tRNA(Met) cytidine acetyltransferase TmcA n=2 Tax=Vibrio galatheae TaxID=579748 RepID=A0A0F4NFW4_9VIBR|nr:ATPase [Vibrio galatheae]
MIVTQHYFSQLLQSATESNHRYGVVLQGDESWQRDCLAQLFSLVDSDDIFLLGNVSSNPVGKRVNYKQGQQLLGQECRLLCCDFREGFDANSFTAATGSVRGGGLVVILPQQHERPTFDQVWLQAALENLIVLKEQGPLPLPEKAKAESKATLTEQAQAVERVKKVVEGHRKRPLVMTADRGRGKSSALGIAAAELIQQRSPIHIVVTAPSLAAVQPVFEHAKRLLPEASLDKGRLQYQQSMIEFVAPDELLLHKKTCDCLFVDEASAIPIPMLQQMVEHYHRAVFSTTVHGYEGCGRGFTVKFQTWLKQERPGTQFFHIEQPIRWSESDPLEQWLFDSFLLDADLGEIVGESNLGELKRVSKQAMVDEPALLRACFALLVNAHYQTSPNDLMLLLQDDAISLYAQYVDGQCLGCILTVEEGNLDRHLIEQIQLGQRRPKGHLVPAMLANQMGIAAAAQQASLRIMRIAVHPSLQRKGYGHNLLTRLIHKTSYDFYSTSFGVTHELLAFWQKCGFEPVKLGSQRDQASGTHSLIMLYGDVAWRNQAQRHFLLSLQYALSDSFNGLEIELVRSLLANCNASVEEPSAVALIRNYGQGGSSFDSVAPFLEIWWRRSPKLVALMSDLLVRRVVQKWSWTQCKASFGYAGNKHAETAFREQLLELLSQIQSDLDNV